MDATSIDAVRLEGLGKRYGSFDALADVSLAIPRGQLFGLIGHNGAGKSTLFKLLLNLLVPSSGRIWLGGVEVRGTSSRETRRSVGYLPENLVLYDNLSGLETLRFFARLKAAPLAQCGELLERVGLGAAGGKPVREYSKGMRQRLGFAQALLGQPQLLLLDEPTTGLDPAATREFFAQLDALRAQGVTIVISSHVLAELQNRVDSLAMLASGRLAAQGTVQTLRERSGRPLRVVVTARPERIDGLCEALAGFQGLDLALDRTAADTLSIGVPRGGKLALLRTLAPHALDDIQMHEPSLEDLYFDLREGAAGVSPSGRPFAGDDDLASAAGVGTATGAPVPANRELAARKVAP